MRRPNDDLPKLILSLFVRIDAAANRQPQPSRSGQIETPGLAKLEAEYWERLENEIRDSRNT